VSASINLMPTVSFAFATASLFGLIAFVRYLAAYITATIGAAVFAFAAINPPEPVSALWSAVRASMITVVVPPTALVAGAILVPLVGWRMAAIQTLGTCAVVVFLLELVALTIEFVPFTRPYPPGHANLKSLWWLYLLGLFAFAYWPARIELSSIKNAAPLFEMIASLAVAIGALEIVGRRRTARLYVQGQEDWMDDPFSVTVLDIWQTGPTSSRVDPPHAGRALGEGSRKTGAGAG
jgi:hypothetical protein